jgi:N-acetylglucosaminyldiphosphoundecaprenol N-acetyl-beta-D-mannosaminyltransferase
LTRLLVGFVVLGIYLAATALFEVGGHWSLVFPKYIANPALGTHFGRARGPELNAVSLGMYLTACMLCAWTLLALAKRCWQQLLLLGALPLMAVGVCGTYTRSTWLGLAASALVVATIQIPRRWRLPAITMAAFAGLLVVAASWTQLVGLQREGTVADSEHSVDQRKSFAYVSWQMFRDHPVLGVGFGRFYDRKLPYLSDRSQDFELDSIRPLDHHNTLLSVLTETGLVGLAMFVAMFGVWTRCAWHLAHNTSYPRWVRAQGVLMLALLANYLCSAVFHDLTFLASQQRLLFVFAGLTMNVWQDAAAAVIDPRTRKPRHAPGLRKGRGAFPLATPATTVSLLGTQITRATINATVGRALGWHRQRRSDSRCRVSLLGVGVTDITKQDAIRRLEEMIRSGHGRCRSIFFVNAHTLNVATDEPDFRDVLNSADLVLNDGTGVRWAARQRGIELRDNLNGTDLIPEFLQATAGGGYRVFLLGADPESIEKAAAVARQRFAGWTLAGYHHGYVHNGQTDDVIHRINASGADLLLVGMGNPIQERWIQSHREQLRVSLAVGVGGLFDHWIDKPRRAPLWVRRAGCEWMHKLMLQPHKWRRYLIGNPKFIYRMTRLTHSDIAAMRTGNGAAPDLALATI